MKHSISQTLFCRIVVGLTLFFGLNAFAQNKKTVCSITINSKDEREFFKSNLSTSEFNFVELVPSAPRTSSSNPNWLEDSCNPNLRCDVLLISGHFNGISFFGDSKYELSLELMERLACTQKCGGIFHAPKEVYLLGCNTLAGKDKDSRTPEQYYQALRDHHVSETEAQQATAIRYSPLGNTSSERMQRLFAGVPRLYGFHSKGPLGSYNKLVLPKLFNLFGDYTQHLNSVEIEQNILLQTGRSPDLSQSDWLNVFSARNGTNCSGALPSDANLALICRIHNIELPMLERMQALVNLLNREDGSKYILVAHAFLEKNIRLINTTETLEKLAEIRSNAKIHSEVFKLIPYFESSPNVRINLIELAYLVGWMTFSEFEVSAAWPAQKLFEQPASVTSKKTICGYDQYFGRRLKYNLNGFNIEKFHSSYYETSFGLDAMACMRITSDAHVTRLFNEAQNPQHPLYIRILNTLSATGTHRSEIQRFFYDLTFSQDPLTVTTALLGIAGVDATGPHVITRLQQLMQSPDYAIRSQAESTYKYQVRVGIIKPAALPPATAL